MAPWEPVKPLLALNYDRYRTGLFVADFGHSQISGHSGLEEGCKIRQKQPWTVSVIAQRPLRLQSFPRCHFKDKCQSNLYVLNTCSEKNSCSSPRCD